MGDFALALTMAWRRDHLEGEIAAALAVDEIVRRARSPIDPRVCERRGMSRRFGGFGRRGDRGRRRPSGAAPWDPSQLDSLEAWYRADDVVLSGSSITTWTDKSGNGRDLTQATGTAQPTQVDRAGQKAASFDAGDFMKTTFAANLAQPSDWFIVAEATDFSSNRYLFDADANVARNAAYCSSTSGPGRVEIYAGIVFATGNPAAPAATIFAVGARFNGASSKVWLDDFRDGSESTGSAGSQAAGGVTLGASHIPSLHLLGYVWELIVVGASTDAATRKQIGDYLSARYDGLVVTT